MPFDEKASYPKEGGWLIGFSHRARSSASQPVPWVNRSKAWRDLQISVRRGMIKYEGSLL